MKRERMIEDLRAYAAPGSFSSAPAKSWMTPSINVPLPLARQKARIVRTCKYMGFLRPFSGGHQKS